MPTRTWPIYRDTLLARSGSTELGGGDDEHLPIGVSGSYDFKALLKFGASGSLDWSGVTKILSARMYLKTTGKVHVTSWGATPDLIVERNITGNFSENGGRSGYDSPSGGGWSTGATHFGSPAAANGSNDIAWSLGNNESTWYSVDITGIVNQWAPASVLQSGGAPGGNQPNYGIVLRPDAYDVGSSVEFFSRKSGYDPYIVLTYESNTAPNAPSALSPAGSTVVADTTPDLSFLYDDPQSDPASKFQVQVATDAGFTAIVYDSGEVASSAADNTTITQTCGTTLTRGTTYYWRAKAWDDAGLASAWSATAVFVVNSLPVATLLTPNDITGRLAKMVYTPGSGWTTPRMEVAWSYSDGQGQAQSDYELEVVTDSGGSPTGAVLASGVVSGAATTVTVAATFVENTRYHVRVRVKDGLEWSGWSGWYICRVRWGLDTHRKDVSIGGIAPTSWNVKSFSATVDPTKNAIVIEYNSSDDGTANLGAVWQPSLASVTKRKWVHYRVWFTAWGASPVTRATLNDITFSTSGNVRQPDFWLPVPLSSQKGSLELDDRVFGSLSLRMDGDGSAHYISQQVRVTPNTDYVLQGRVRSTGNSGGKVYLADTQNGAALTNAAAAAIQTAPLTADADWTQGRSPVWNSGARSTVWVHCYINGATGTIALFDGLKLERGQVASPWVPGLVGSAGVVVDAGGVQIDASGGTGALFRLRTTGGNVIDLGASSLELDGVPLVPYAHPAESGTSFPGSPTTGQRWFRTDLGMEFFYDGTRWLCSCPHELFIPFRVTDNYAATTPDAWRVGVPYLTTSGIYIEEWVCNWYTNSGTLNASNKWTDNLFLHGKDGGADSSVIASCVCDSGAAAQYHRTVVPVDAVYDLDLYAAFGVNATLTGTNGVHYNWNLIRYRHVAT